MLMDLVNLSDKLDKRGLHDLSSMTDKIIIEASSIDDTTKGLALVIRMLTERAPSDKRFQYRQTIAKKLLDLNAMEIASKKSPASGSIGAAITVVKNTLNGKDANYIHSVVKKLYLTLIS